MAFIQGTSGDDELEGTEFADTINGLGGTDVITGLGGNDTIDPGQGGRLNQDDSRDFEMVDAGAGNDQVTVVWLPDIDPAYHDVTGGTGTDLLVFDASQMSFVDFEFDENGEPVRASNLTLYRLHIQEFERLLFFGPESDDEVAGLSGADQLFGHAGEDELRGNDGDDYLNGGSGVDEMFGGDGDDRMIVNARGENAFGGAGTDLVLSEASHALRVDTENLTLIGNAPVNGSGNALDNIITGNLAANILTGNDGNDWLDGYYGIDTMRGGLGNDTYVVRDTGDKVQESSAAAGTDTVRSYVSYTLGVNLEHLVLVGDDGVDGTGNSLFNQITGNRGANSLRGEGGNDVLRGAGGDELWGGNGSDYLRGDAGADGFYFDTAPGSSNRDRILDFNSGEDHIFLDNGVYTGLPAPGPLPAAAFRSGANAADASDRIIYHQSTGNIFYDADGVGGVDKVLFATVEAGMVITHADFIVF
jgi:Ca2+-binding RTX toxin-like protein